MLPDVYFARNPAHHPWMQRMQLAYRIPRALAAARRVIIPSVFSRDDVLDLYRVDETKIRIIPHGISDRFLVQILLDLKRAGLVDSTRGAAGGYQLARSPDDITIFDILRVIDPHEQPLRKDDKLNPTVYVRNVRAVWERVVEVQQAVLKDTSLADLLAQSEGIQYVI